jgi:hypothetical protein
MAMVMVMGDIGRADAPLVQFGEAKKTFKAPYDTAYLHSLDRSSLWDIFDNIEQQSIHVVLSR